MHYLARSCRGYDIPRVTIYHIRLQITSLAFYFAQSFQFCSYYMTVVPIKETQYTVSPCSLHYHWNQIIIGIRCSTYSLNRESLNSSWMQLQNSTIPHTVLLLSSTKGHWSDHITRRKCLASLAQLRPLFPAVPRRTRILLYNTLVLPTLSLIITAGPKVLELSYKTNYLAELVAKSISYFSWLAASPWLFKFFFRKLG